MRVTDFDFDLPPQLIAQHPPANRGDSRMMTLSRDTGAFQDRHFRDLPSLLHPGDLLVLNDSRVIPARLFARRAGLRTQANSPAPTGQVEVLLTQPLGNNRWKALVKPGRKVPTGEHLIFGNNDLEATIVDSADFGERTLEFAPIPDFFATLDRLGHIPLPPYIHREKDEEEDKDRYQTIYAGQNTHGSAAAPTAGLHFTPEILNAIQQRGVEIQHITLHVGLGTFQPVRAETLTDIRLHEEVYTLPAATAEALQRARQQNRRIIAVGTTTTRTLEHIAAIHRIEPHSGSTSIFLAPGHRFQLVDALLTNFHLPKSTLLMLIAAFATEDANPEQGRQRILHAYAHAVEAYYRFFSYGDCMFLS